MSDPVSRVVLIGYRCSGKTTVGPLVAARLGWDFVDADVLLESRAGTSIARIFADEGEPAFRERESRILVELCGRSKLVLSTGGGVILRRDNREALRSAGFVAWLDAPAELIWERMRQDPATAARRPNLTAAGGLQEVKELLATREPLYRATAHASFPADRSPEWLADAIVQVCNGGSTSRS
jgi:shikimate kinase